MGTADSRDQFVTARALLRLVLAPEIHVPPSRVALVARCQRCGSGRHGKPRLLDAGLPLAFSLTHVGGCVAIATTPGRAVGVDVEIAHDRTDPEREALAAAALAPQELAAYRRIPADDRGRAMAVWWSRKEAVLKATGDGLAVPPSRVLVSEPGSPAALLGSDADGDSAAVLAPGSARLYDLRHDPGYVGCVAVLGTRRLTVDEHDGDQMLSKAAENRRAG